MFMTRTALITGITGQDGAYLARLLLEKGYRVFGTYRRLSTPNYWRLHYLGVFDKISLIPADLTDLSSLYRAVETAQPDEVYNLAAQSFVSLSFEQPVGDFMTTGLGVARLLEVVRTTNRSIRFYQASTSELYGRGAGGMQNEQTVFHPSSPYAAAKLYGYWITRYYREHHGIFACNGILFNHESPLRGLEFVTRKITNTVAKIKLGLVKELVMGNLEARRDWGYAPEFVNAMWLMLQQDSPDDYVVATGEAHSVAEFVERAFQAAGLGWRDHVRTDSRFLRPIDVDYLCGDAGLARTRLGWRPMVKFDRLVEIMVQEDIERWQRWQRGEFFHWDALNYESEHNIILSRDRGYGRMG